MPNFSAVIIGFLALIFSTLCKQVIVFLVDLPYVLDLLGFSVVGKDCIVLTFLHIGVGYFTTCFANFQCIRDLVYWFLQKTTL